MKTNNSNSHIKDGWNKEAQLQKNQPLMELIKQWRQENSDRIPTEEEIYEYQEIQKSLERNRANERV